jgi:hypothetical protein
LNKETQGVRTTLPIKSKAIPEAENTASQIKIFVTALESLIH